MPWEHPPAETASPKENWVRVRLRDRMPREPGFDGDAVGDPRRRLSKDTGPAILLLSNTGCRGVGESPASRLDNVQRSSARRATSSRRACSSKKPDRENSMPIRRWPSAMELWRTSALRTMPSARPGGCRSITIVFNGSVESSTSTKPAPWIEMSTTRQRSHSCVPRAR
jgi:hypothetical protein